MGAQISSTSDHSKRPSFSQANTFSTKTPPPSSERLKNFDSASNTFPFLYTRHFLSLSRSFCQGVSKSLLAVQVTELVDGFFIGCSLNHSAADGTSFWHFFNTWSEISRSMGFGAKPISQIPPNFERHSFFNGILELPVKFSFPDDTELNIQSSGDNGNSIQLKQRVFRFSKEKIAELKAKANSQMGTSKISSFQALLAHIWQCVTRNRPVDDEDVVKYNVIVGTRSRLQPPLPPQYFGSAALIRSVKATAGELKKPEALGWAAWEIHKLTHILTTGSSPRFDVYGNDFGWGRPVAVRSGGANKSDGKITVFEGAEEGSIQFEVCLSAKTLQALGEDVDFMATIST
ncbi:HXXXD-type acyl-transferase family protein [Quillaja saponaria]|uniref:HXXXD-type acyl-transferase family protein n=1 Tax=Quillaja saponaria TaxID=32244 RepID=A0AAD7LQD2_QUISA|nr:HXXXD-type acyl-transferase family protein [Quillaja saponaria]